MSEKLRERLKALESEYLYFERVGETWEEYRQAAIRKLVECIPIGSSMTMWAGDDKTLIRCEFEAIAAATEQDLRYMTRCGIYWDDQEKCLAIDHLTGLVRVGPVDE